MTNRQTATMLRLRSWIFFNIVAEFEENKKGKIVYAFLMGL